MDTGLNLGRKLVFCLMAFAAILVAGQNVTAEEKQPVAKNNGASSGWSAEIAENKTTGISLDQTQIDLINKVSKYFSDLDSMRGRFRQTGADGKVMKGKFWLKQPGMFRFDYARPSLQVIISDGTYLAIQDRDIQTEDRVELDQTPFRVLLRQNVDLLRDARILEVQQTDKVLLLTVTDKASDNQTRIKLFFEFEPQFELSEWVTTDLQGLETRVQIGNLVKGEKTAASKFKIEPMWGRHITP